MNERKMKLIEAGLSLFALKGYHATSIQEITDEAGVSKGLFYQYFSSKEEFLATAFLYFHNKITKKLEHVKEENLLSKQKLAKQISVLFEYIYLYQDFIITYFRENKSIGEKTDSIISHMNKQNFTWLRDNVIEIYGEKVEHILFDVVVQLEGLLNGYFKWMIIEHIEIDFSEIGTFIVRRLDSLVQGMLLQEETGLFENHQLLTDQLNEPIDNILIEISNWIKTSPLTKSEQAQLDEVLTALKNELNKKSRQDIIIQGLLAHFQKYNELNHYCQEIAISLNINLIK